MTLRSSGLQLSKEQAAPIGEEPAAYASKSGQAPQESSSSPRAGRGGAWKRKTAIAGIGVVVLAGLGVFGVPKVGEVLSTVSTDDAYVNGHVTFVAPRVPGQVSRVLVDDNNRVHKGDLLAELDKEPYLVAVSEKRAAVDVARADLVVATAAVRGTEAQARSR